MTNFRCLTLLMFVAVILLEITEVHSIVGGNTAMPGTATYVVAIRDIAGSSFICAGALVKTNWVLTTARCMSSKTAADLSVLAGSHRLLTNKKVNTVTQISQHPTYDSVTGAHNLALLKLSEPVTISTRVNTIALNDASAATGTVTVFYGWGALVYGSTSYSNSLQTLLQRTLSATDCRTRITGLAEGDLCAYIQRGQAACTKDEGGPLVQYDTGKLVGIYTHGTQCSGAMPDVFVDVYSHKTWIESVAV